MIRRLRTVLVQRSVPSQLDQRKKVDRHIVAYACPPDPVHDTEHEWLAEFEVGRDRIYEPPPKFADKWEAYLYSRSIHERR